MLRNVCDCPEYIQSARQNIQDNLKRKFNGKHSIAVLGGIFWLSTSLSLILVPLYYYASRAPQYAINKKVFFGNNDSSLERLGCLYYFVLIPLAFPFLIIKDFIENYTGENILKK